MNQQTTLHIRRSIFVASTWTVLLILTGIVLPVIGQTPAGGDRSRGTEEAPRAQDDGGSRHFREVAARLQENRSIPVIVKLRLRGRDGSVGPQDARNLQAIQTTQNTLIGEMTGYDPTSIKRFRYVPFLRLRIDASGYERLRASPLVADVQEDRAVHPDLVTRPRAVKTAPGAVSNRIAGEGGKGLSVVMIGAGIERNHPDLAGRVTGETCFSTGDSSLGITSLCASEERTDCSIAGAACVGDTERAILAAGRDSQADKVSLIPIQVYSRIGASEGCPGGGESCLVAYDSDVVLGLEKVLEVSGLRRIAAVSLNVSNLRMTENCDHEGSALTAAINRLREAGIPTVSAMERAGGGHSCAAGAIIASQIPSFTGEGAELAGLFSVARAIAPWAGVEALQAALSGVEGDYDRFSEAMDLLAGVEDGEGLISDGTGSIDIVSSRPAAPTELLGSALSTSRIELTWRDNSDNEEGFAIRRKRLEDKNWTVINVVARNTTTFRDTGLFPGTTYLYTVTAVNPTGESAGSNETQVGLPIYDFLIYSNGIPVNSSLHPNRYDYYRLSVPFGATQLLVQTYGSGNSDLYVRYGSLPGLFKFDCRSTLDTTSDRCVFSYPQAGDWFIMVYGNANSVISYTMSATYLTGVENNRPGAPTNLLATATSFSQISLSWEDNSSNEVGFSIRRRIGQDGTPVQIATVSQNVTSYFDTGLSSDVTYYYTVVAYNLAGFSASSNDANATTPGQLTTRPVQPINLQATATAGGVINLRWADVSSNEAGFSIRRRAFLNNLWQVIGTVGPNVTSYADRQVVPGTTYFYTVTATNSAGESPLSNEALVTSAGSGTAENTAITPLNVMATSVSTNRVILRWTDNSSNEFGFRIRRKEGTDGLWILLAIVDQNVTTYQDDGVTPGSTYYYTITSFSMSGESATSSETAVSMPTFAFTPLENGVMLPHTVGRYRLRYYRINVPSGASELLIQTKGSGSTEMYVRNGLIPTNFYYNCRSLSDTTNNRCYFLNPTPGDWYILLTSNSLQGSIYQLTATYKMGVNLDTLTPTGR